MIGRNSTRTSASSLVANTGNTFPACIDKDDVLALDLERERRLSCKNGLLWVTIQNDRNDYLLKVDKEMRIPGNRKVIVEAEEPSCFQID
jgi:hypothetical protein